MGRSPCCDKVGLKKGPWTPEEDQKLLAYIEEHGHGSWRALPAKAGLQRCGKSCRLRWTNYLRPDIKRGKFSLQEEQTIIQLHALLGNRWSAIATHLPKRTDNEIKNYWNTHLKKRLTRMGIDPATHKPKNDALLSGDGHPNNKTAANLSHMAQWESARLEAEARLVRESKLRSHSLQQHLGTSSTLVPTSSSSSSSAPVMTKLLNEAPITMHWTNGSGGDGELESPKSTLSNFSENNAPPIMSTSSTNGFTTMIEFVGTTSTNSGSSNCENNGGRTNVKEESEEEWKLGYEEYKDDEAIMENSMPFNSSSLLELTILTSAEEGFTNLLLNANNSNSDELSLSCEGGSGKSNINNNNNKCAGGSGSDFYEDNKNYWNSILHLVNSSPSDDSPMF